MKFDFKVEGSRSKVVRSISKMEIVGRPMPELGVSAISTEKYTLEAA